MLKTSVEKAIVDLRSSPRKAHTHIEPAPSTCGRSKSVGSDLTLLSAREEDSPTLSTRPGLGQHSASQEHSYSTPAVLPVRTKNGTPDRASDPHGLSLLHAPSEPHVADIIFVHGLGCSSRLSWSKNKDLGLFWPQEWLPLDSDVQRARIFSFGYNAFFQSSAQTGTIGITDFAKNLLYDMLYGRDNNGNSLHLGHVSRFLKSR